ncbi:ATP-binding protein [Epilithonimonas sp. JDS]|uniref:ATP-binding protein n=1 Tax=Epilithonimonas sp. JDS TaxID=2902797 RepID=UPI001E42C767|nr:ATP-binding protein [Epilithonimonas sp. JDS]MCD9856017.1 ATP-binding protein [Epilithonimonas sp. JDS]
MKAVPCNEIVIHHPGYIQSFGYLLGVNALTNTIEFYSDNVPTLFELDHSILGQRADSIGELGFIVGSPQFVFVVSSAEDDVKYIDRILINSREHHITYYRHNDIIYIELEACILNAKDNSILVKKIKNLISLRQGGNIWEFLVEKIKEITDYDRVMIYQFNEDKSGKVIAEAKNANMESYLDLHYPESDIPSQARALYLKNFKRILSDVNDKPVRILSNLENVDLSISSVRALSPIHVEYLINAKIASSFSISIIIDNELWGLVTCHSTYQKHIDLDHRISAEIATFIAANSYHSFLSANILEYDKILISKCQNLKIELLSFQNIADSVSKNINKIREISETEGFAAIIDGQITTSGRTPNSKTLEKIIAWAKTNLEDQIYYDNSFYKTYGKKLGLDKSCCGIALSFINKDQGNVLMWFKGEFQQQISWAGKKENKIKTIRMFDEKTTVVSPRQSFEVYNEEILDRSASWDSKDKKRVIAVKEIIDRTIQEQLFHISNLNAELYKVNSELGKVNEELDAYSHTISHDLATPLTVMKLNMQIMAKLNTENTNIKLINNVLNEIDNMSDMMTNVLKLSRLKYSEYDIIDIDPAKIIDKAISDAKLSYNDSAQVTIENIFRISGEKSMVTQVFQNIITNAVKYSAKKDSEAKIHISSYLQDDNVVFEIEDNGIGIPYTSKKDVFKIFNRMSNTKSYFGSGVGLSIVESIMKKLNGSIDFESVENQGTKFIVTFPSGVS